MTMYKEDIIESYQDEEETKKIIEKWQESSSRDIEYSLVMFFLNIIAVISVFYFTKNVFYCFCYAGYLYIITYLLRIQHRQTRIASILLLILDKIK